jgi:hypothetical protein
MLDNFSTGYNHFINEDYNSAISYFLKIPDYQNNFQILYYLAYSYFQMGNFSKSKEYSQVCFYHKPLDTINTKILILSCIYLSEKEEAKKYTNIYMQKAYIPDDDIVNLYEKLNGKNYYESINYPKLNILFIQESVGIRCYKFAKALISKGHKITLGYVSKKGSETYKGLDDSIFERCIKINDIQKIGDLCKNFDVIQCHNEPDYLTLQALTGNRPVIHDTADLISLRDIENANTSFFEGLANKLAHGRIYSTVYQKAKAESIYELKTPALVFGNYISESDRPKEFLPKLSSVDNLIHIVYQGSISLYKHRNFIDIFITLVKQGLVVHIYPVTYNKELADFFNEIPNIYYHEPVTPGKLLTELTKYDIGIIPWNLELGQKSFLDTTIANKLYEYLAAGLPVITSDVKSYRDYFAVNPVGSVFENFENIIEKLKSLILSCKNKKLVNFALSYENEIYKLEKFYFEVINEFNKKNNIPSNILLLNKFYKNKYDFFDNVNKPKKSSKKVDNVLFIMQSVESIGGGAITLKEMTEEFRSRNSNVFLLTSKISDEDLVDIKNSFNEIFISDLLIINDLPQKDILTNLNNIVEEIIKKQNIELVISFPFFMAFFIKFSVKVIFYITYEPNFSGKDLELKKEFVKNNASKLLFINKPGINLLKSYFDNDISKIDFNYIGIPIQNFNSLIGNTKSNFFNDGVLKILIISRLAPTKSFILNVVEDVCKLLKNGYPIELTIIGEGVLKDLISVIISYYGVIGNIRMVNAMYPLNYEVMLDYDISINTGTTSIITAALGIPTLMAMPTLWFEYFGYFSGYAGSVGILGYDYDYFQDSLVPSNQRYTYYEYIKSIFEHDDIPSYLKVLSEISKNYCKKYEDYFDREKIVDSILSYTFEIKS